MATSFPFKPIITDGLIFYIDAINNKSYIGSGTSSYDMVDLKLGDIKNGTTFNNGFFDFDGIDDYINFGDVFDFDGSTPFSISTWVKTSYNTTAQGTIVSKSKGVTPWTGYVFGFNICTSTFQDIGKIGFTVVDDSTPSYVVIRRQSVNPINDGLWHNAVITYDGSKLRSGMLLYDNGLITTMTNYDSSSFVGSLSNNINLEIGARDGAQYNSEVSIASTAIYNKALTEAEVLQNYNAQKNRFI